jgi:hypothetical protein
LADNERVVDLFEIAPPGIAVLQMQENSMSEATNNITRQPIHNRQIHIDGYLRSDGLWDIEGTLTDVKHVTHIEQGAAMFVGPPSLNLVHKMSLRITVDNQLNVIDAVAGTQAAPYPGVCDNIAPSYARLKGVRIGAGFGKQVTTLFGTTKGCAHITELLGRIAAGAVQTVIGLIPLDPDAKPFQLDGCHALATDGALVAKVYPRWYLKPA